MPHAYLSRGAFARAVYAAAMAFAVAFGNPSARAEAGEFQGRFAPVVTPRSAYGDGGRAMRVAHSSYDLVAVALSFDGSRKFTPYAGPWCADAASAWLVATGRRPLANRLAASALRYGPHVAYPRPGDLVVMNTRLGYAHHVGIVLADRGARVEIISGNWSHRVMRALIWRASVAAFVRV